MKNVIIIALEEQKLIDNKLMHKNEEIHTYEGWKRRGFIVKKGEKAIAKFPIWKQVTNKDGEEHMFMKNSCWFSTRQVQKV